MAVASQLVIPFAPSPLGRFSRGGVPLRPLARVSHAAVRVPDPRHTDIALTFPPGHPQIFVHEGARQALERRLSTAHHRPVLLSVTDNRRHMISHSVRGGILQARIHHMFLDAPGPVQEALIRYVVRGERDASAIVSRFIDENGYRIRAIRPVVTPLTTQGKTHDLLALFRMLNEKYFGNQVDALVTWGKRSTQPRTQPRRSIKLGSYSAVERLIRVHPVLDKPWVPRYFISYILYHEMLHHVIPASQGSGRRMLHPPIFLEREGVFRDYERSLAWEKAHIGRLLRS
jgi:hypothetical protein